MLKNIFKLKDIQNVFKQNNSLPSVTVLQNQIRKTLAYRCYAQLAQDDNTEVAESIAKKPRNPFAQKSLGIDNDFESDLLDTSIPKVPLTDEERDKRLKVLQLEADIAYQEGRRVPKLEFFKKQHWDQVLSMRSKSARIKYYAYLWQIAMKRESQERKKVERAEASVAIIEELRKQREENNHIIYGLGHVSMFLRIYDSTIDRWQNQKLIRAMQFSPKIVLDCSYDQYMNRREAVNAAKQLTFCFAENRSHDDPFDMHYCNVDLESTCMQALQKHIPTMLNPEFPLNVHKKCYTEIFPKENLVYLTPHCRTDLEVYNPDDIYVIGAMVDTINNEPLSLAKAKRLGLRMARLPLDRYLQWGAGSGKSLTLNHMVNILLDLKTTGDWNKALTHVPRRKIVDLSVEPQRQRQKLYNRADKLNVRLDRILNLTDDSRNSVTSTRSSPPNTIRSKKENMQFNLDTWGTKKKVNDE